MWKATSPPNPEALPIASVSITADELVTLHWDRDQPVDITALTGVLDQPRVIAWSGITIARNESHDGFWLRLTVTDPRVCRIKVHADVSPEVCDPIGGWWRMALVDGDTLVYLTARRLEADDDVCWELGTIGHGPAAAELTEYLCDEIRAWGPERNQRTPSLIVYLAGTPDSELAGPAIDKIGSRFVLTYDNLPGTAPRADFM